MSGTKNIINKTGYQIVGTIVGRTGDNPQNGGKTVDFQIPANQSQVIQYGNDQNPYMNTLSVSTKTDGTSKVDAIYDVITRGGFIDNLFNTNSNITVTMGSTGLLIQGSN
jgi:hypothetical protein